MNASKENPTYSVIVISGTNKYNITDAVESLEYGEAENELAAKVVIDIMNVQVGNSQLYNLINEVNRVYVYANDGSQNEEVFRGFVWTKQYKESVNDRTLQLKCYDNLIYFQESEESEYFSSGNSTQTVMSALCNKWGVSLQYSYSSITHSKLVLRGNLADIFITDILDVVKDRTGKKYVIRSTKDVMQVLTVGTNKTIYSITAKDNAVSTTSLVTMDGVITKVKILGKADGNDRRPVEAEVSGNTAKYGTLQKLIDRNENTSLTDAKTEAQNIIKEDGTPKWEYIVEAPDIPWIRKGDIVSVQAGNLNNMFLAAGVEHSITNNKKTMTLSLIKSNLPSEPQAKSFVTKLYVNVLNRNPDSSGLNHWTGKLISGNMTGTDVTIAFFNSAEYTKKKTTNAQFVTDCYKGFLDRAPDKSGYNNWISKLNGGTARSAVLNGFASSAEFKKRLATYNLT